MSSDVSQTEAANTLGCFCAIVKNRSVTVTELPCDASQAISSGWLVLTSPSRDRDLRHVLCHRSADGLMKSYDLHGHARQGSNRALALEQTKRPSYVVVVAAAAAVAHEHADRAQQHN